MTEADREYPRAHGQHAQPRRRRRHSDKNMMDTLEIRGRDESARVGGAGAGKTNPPNIITIHQEREVENDGGCCTRERPRCTSGRSALRCAGTADNEQQGGNDGAPFAGLRL